MMAYNLLETEHMSRRSTAYLLDLLIRLTLHILRGQGKGEVFYIPNNRCRKEGDRKGRGCRTRCCKGDETDLGSDAGDLQGK
jgi:hypothetical protein